jgi:hypothetical protein
VSSYPLEHINSDQPEVFSGKSFVGVEDEKMKGFRHFATFPPFL